MAYDLRALFGSTVSQRSLKLAKSKAIAAYARAKGVHYTHFKGCRLGKDGAETIILELEIELARDTKHAIQPNETVAITILPVDDAFPQVVSLRESFPKVPHLNQRPRGEPKSFCLYDESYAEVKLHWTAHRYVERIRFWLAKTAEGSLHPDDQPLEPLLGFGLGTLVVPEELVFTEESSLVPYSAVANNPSALRSVWTLFRPKDGAKPEKLNTHVVVTLECPKQTHGVITEQPDNLVDLDEFLRPTGYDVVAELRKRIALWKGQKLFEQLKQAHVFLLLKLPKTRVAGGKIEDGSIELAAFFSECTLAEIDKHLENYQISHDYGGTILIPDAVKTSANIGLVPLDVTLEFSPTRAAILSGIDGESRQFCLIGAGALGSQIFSILMRAGFGRWTVIDDDYLLPHNLARHTLNQPSVGRKKAEAVCEVANTLFLTEGVATALVADVVASDKKTEIVISLKAATAVLDCSASVPVARALALDELGASRIISQFLNPAGDAFVCLAEDERRACRIDWLEMQYYREVCRNPSLFAHLRTESRTRYSNACRSLTSRVPQEIFALFGAVGSRTFRETLANPAASIRLWSIDGAMQLSLIEVSPEPVITCVIGDWSICTDQYVLHAVASFRLLRLPNETGGVLIGTYDLERRILYVVDILPSPPDSKEWPTSYRRGSEGLRRAIDDIEHRTLKNLEYVGEWHSHPDGCSADQSGVDRVAMAEITEEMSKCGLPGLMLIAGSSGQYAFYITPSTV